jgi:septum formation protein
VTRYTIGINPLRQSIRHNPRILRGINPGCQKDFANISMLFRALDAYTVCPVEFPAGEIALKLVLASTSPFRKELLGRLQIPFDTMNPEIDEQRFESESATDTVQRLAQEKAQAVALRITEGLIIGSDQCAVLGDKILGKPGSFDNAINQLRESSGQTVVFHTGLCLLDAATGNAQVEDVEFKVRFRKLSDEQIENYLKREDALSCAGSFKSEALGITLFESMEGEDPTSLIGLPLIRLTSMLAREGISLPLPHG